MICPCRTETNSDPCPVCGRYVDGRAPNVPQDATTLNAHQRAAVVEWLAKLPLAELRKRQRLQEKQIELATKVNLNSKTVHGLQIKQHLLDAAVDRKEFDNV